MNFTNFPRLEAVNGRGFDHEVIAIKGRDNATHIAYVNGYPDVPGWELTRLFAFAPRMMDLLQRVSESPSEVFLQEIQDLLEDLKEEHRRQWQPATVPTEPLVIGKDD